MLIRRVRMIIVRTESSLLNLDSRINTSTVKTMMSPSMSSLSTSSSAIVNRKKMSLLLTKETSSSKLKKIMKSYQVHHL